MNSTLKSLVFWVVVLAAATAVYFYANAGTTTDLMAQSNDLISGEWLMAGRADQPSAIFRHGSVLLVVNERGDLATARAQDATHFVVVKGQGWESGVTAEIRENGKSIIWRDGSVWTRR